MKLLLSSLLILTVILSYLAFRHKDTTVVAVHPAKRIEPKVERAPSTVPASVADSVAPSPSVVKVKPVGQPRNDLSVIVPEISQAELERRAAKVEQETNHELARLVTLLELSDEQQNQVFAALAEKSPDYHPAMKLATNELRPLPLPSNFTTPENTNHTAAAASPSALSYGEISATFTPVLVGPKVPSPPTPNTTVAITTPTPSSGNPAVGNIHNSIPDWLNPPLTGPQQDLLAEEEADRIAWWAELTANLAADLPTPAIDAGSTPPAVISTSYNDDL
jgi:hypothetical protein